MAITKNSSRQGLIVAFVDFTAADLAGTNGVLQNAIELPQGAVVTDGDLTVSTPFNQAVSMTVGDATVTNRYGSVTSTSLQSVSRSAIAPTGFSTTYTERNVTLLPSFSTVPTVGSARLTVTYYVAGRTAFTQG